MLVAPKEMLRGYRSHRNASYHTGVVIHQDSPSGRFKVANEQTPNFPDYNIPKESVVILPEGQRFVSVLWAGGWDEYVIDTTNIRELTPDELARIAEVRKKGGGVSPTLNGFLLGMFIEQKIEHMNDNNCVKIVRRLAGGD